MLPDPGKHARPRKPAETAFMDKPRCYCAPASIETVATAETLDGITSRPATISATREFAAGTGPAQILIQP